MSNSIRLSILLLVVGLTVNLFAQPSASENGTINNPTKHFTKEASENETKPIAPQPVTNEFGYFNNNAVFSTGATGYAAAFGVFNENFDGSLEAWIYQTATTSLQASIVAKGDATNIGCFIGVDNAAGSVLCLRFGNTFMNNAGGIAIPLNTWTHVAVTWAGSPGAHTLNFYVNGVQSGPVNIAYAGTWNVTADSLIVGDSKPFGSDQWLGMIDEVKYWSNVRTLAQIRDNRFVGLGDLPNSNTATALTSSSHYATLNDSWSFNTGSFSPDYIGGTTAYYRGTSSAIYAPNLGTPIPYNYILQCPFGANDFVTVPTNAGFNASTGGSAEAWVYPTGQTTTHMIMSRGTTGFDFFWGVRASISNKQAVDIGSGTQFQNSDGVAIPLNAWSHVAIVWVQNGGNYTVTFYVNGQQSGTPQTNATTWTSTSGTMRIGGWHGGTANHWNGWIDEARFWNVTRTRDQIVSTMFCSARGMTAGSATGMVGAWDFDGNLLNFGSATGIDGSFSTGGTNNCRFSGFDNESTTGTPGTTFRSYITTVNRVAASNPFPGGFAVRAPFKPIVDNATTYDTLTISGAGTVTSAEVFVSIRHTFCADLTIIVKAPNGTTRTMALNRGSSGDNILTFFVDGGPVLSNAAFLAPWSNTAGPEAAMGTFGGSPTNGQWVISVADGAGGDVGFVQGWGLRLNGTLTAITPNQNVPGKYELAQNYPNPFNPTTSINFSIPKDGAVKLTVYDLLGREVKTLVNEFKKAGIYDVKFDASSLASGTYFYRIESGNFTSVKKMVLVK